VVVAGFVAQVELANNEVSALANWNSPMNITATTTTRAFLHFSCEVHFFDKRYRASINIWSPFSPPKHRVIIRTVFPLV
jgi:hypothetical protein